MATQANEHDWLEPLPWLACLLPTFPVTIPQTIRGSELKERNPREQDWPVSTEHMGALPPDAKCSQSKTSLSSWYKSPVAEAMSPQVTLTAQSEPRVPPNHLSVSLLSQLSILKEDLILPGLAPWPCVWAQKPKWGKEVRIGVQGSCFLSRWLYGHCGVGKRVK